jgi:hypothetical protein
MDILHRVRICLVLLYQQSVCRKMVNWISLVGIACIFCTIVEIWELVQRHPLVIRDLKLIDIWVYFPILLMNVILIWCDSSNFRTVHVSFAGCCHAKWCVHAKMCSIILAIASYIFHRSKKSSSPNNSRIYIGSHSLEVWHFSQRLRVSYAHSQSCCNRCCCSVLTFSTRCKVNWSDDVPCFGAPY